MGRRGGGLRVTPIVRLRGEGGTEAAGLDTQPRFLALMTLARTLEASGVGRRECATVRAPGPGRIAHSRGSSSRSAEVSGAAAAVSGSRKEPASRALLHAWWTSLAKE